MYIYIYIYIQIYLLRGTWSVLQMRSRPSTPPAQTTLNDQTGRVLISTSNQPSKPCHVAQCPQQRHCTHSRVARPPRWHTSPTSPGTHIDRPLHTALHRPPRSIHVPNTGERRTQHEGKKGVFKRIAHISVYAQATRAHCPTAPSPTALSSLPYCPPQGGLTALLPPNEQVSLP